MNAPQHAARQKRQIQREVDNGIRILDDAVGHFVATGGHHRYQNRRLREFLMEFLDQRTCGHNLPDRCCMHPYTVLLCHFFQGMFRIKAQALTDTLHKALFPDRADHKHRDNQYDDQNRR